MMKKIMNELNLSLINFIIIIIIKTAINLIKKMQIKVNINLH